MKHFKDLFYNETQLMMQQLKHSTIKSRINVYIHQEKRGKKVRYLKCIEDTSC